MPNALPSSGFNVLGGRCVTFLPYGDTAYRMGRLCRSAVAGRSPAKGGADRIQLRFDPPAGAHTLAERRPRLDATLAPAAGRTVTKLPGHCQSFDRGPKGQSGDGGACGALQVWLHRVGSSP